jgi:hypothetical protein
MELVHPHTPADVAPGTVTLCATSAISEGGPRWAHLPVDRLLWADEALRDGLLERVRREVGDQSAGVEVVEAAE